MTSGRDVVLGTVIVLMTITATVVYGVASPNAAVTVTSSTTLSQRPLVYTLVSAGADLPPNYMLGSGSARITLVVSVLKIDVSISDVNPNTMYKLVFTYNASGSDQAHNRVLAVFAVFVPGGGVSFSWNSPTIDFLRPGTYNVGIRLYDVTTFEDPTLVLTSSPAYQQLTIF